jgi:hypothetical protein
MVRTIVASEVDCRHLVLRMLAECPQSVICLHNLCSPSGFEGSLLTCILDFIGITCGLFILSLSFSEELGAYTQQVRSHGRSTAELDLASTDSVCTRQFRSILECVKRHFYILARYHLSPY